MPTRDRRYLLKAAPHLDPFGEFSTETEAFVAIGSKAQLRTRTRGRSSRGSRRQTVSRRWGHRRTVG
jgi:hypothetical protein